MRSSLPFRDLSLPLGLCTIATVAFARTSQPSSIFGRSRSRCNSDSGPVAVQHFDTTMLKHIRILPLFSQMPKVGLGLRLTVPGPEKSGYDNALRLTPLSGDR